MSSDAARFPIFLDYKKRYAVGSSRPLTATKDSWLPVYFATRDGSVLGAWVCRTLRDCCEIALFLAEDHHRYVRGTAVRRSLLGILTQVYHQTGSMEIRFKGPGPGQAPSLETGFEPVVPSQLRTLAGELGVGLSQPDRISDNEGRLLYLRLTGFSRSVVTSCAQRGIDLLRASVLVHRDIWSMAQVDYLLEHAARPERIFDGGTSPLDRLAYQHDLLVMRVAVLEERLRIILDRFSGAPPGFRVAADWLSATEVRYTSSEVLHVPVREGETLQVDPASPLRARLVPRTLQGYLAFAEADYAAHRVAGGPVTVVTKDIACTPLAGPEADARLLPVFDTLAEIDAEIVRRLDQAKNCRSEISERHE